MRRSTQVVEPVVDGLESPGDDSEGLQLEFGGEVGECIEGSKDVEGPQTREDNGPVTMTQGCFCNLKVSICKASRAVL